MKIAIIGATGNLGRRLVRKALEQGFEVRAFVRNAERASDLGEGVELVERDLFSLSASDLSGADALVSAFGSGFSADPSINRDAFEKYLELTYSEELGRDVQLVAIAGEGVLFTDASHTQHRFETEGYSKRLYPISRYTSEGVDLLEASAKQHWTVVCPAGTFEADGPATGDVMLCTTREIFENEDGERYVSYDDLAATMLSCVGSSEHDRQVMSAATRTRATR